MRQLISVNLMRDRQVYPSKIHDGGQEAKRDLCLLLVFSCRHKLGKQKSWRSSDRVKSASLCESKIQARN
jgi:hypothetical protein